MLNNIVKKYLLWMFFWSFLFFVFGVIYFGQLMYWYTINQIFLINIFKCKELLSTLTLNWNNVWLRPNRDPMRDHLMLLRGIRLLNRPRQAHIVNIIHLIIINIGLKIARVTLESEAITLLRSRIEIESEMMIIIKIIEDRNKLWKIIALLPLIWSNLLKRRVKIIRNCMKSWIWLRTKLQIWRNMCLRRRKKKLSCSRKRSKGRYRRRGREKKDNFKRIETIKAKRRLILDSLLHLCPSTRNFILLRGILTLLNTMCTIFLKLSKVIKIKSL